MIPKYWKYILIAAGIILLIFGISYAYKEYKFLKEKAAINDKQEEIQAELERADLQHIVTEEDLIRQIAQKDTLLTQKDREIGQLEYQISHIPIPVNSNDLVDAWNRAGIRARRIIAK